MLSEPIEWMDSADLVEAALSSELERQSRVMGKGSSSKDVVAISWHAWEASNLGFKWDR